MKKQRLKQLFYTQGRFGKGYRETLDIDNPYLYARGHYPTKLTKEDMPEDYIKFFSRSIWYMTGYIKTSGIVDLYYTYAHFNHLFKDDYIYISYKKKITLKKDSFGWLEPDNYDLVVCGNDIIDILLAANKYSHFNINKIREKIEERRLYLKKHYPDYYSSIGLEDRDIITQWIEKGYVDKKLIADDFPIKVKHKHMEVE